MGKLVMNQARLLIANRGEIAIRIARTAIDRQIMAFGVYAEDDLSSLHNDVVDVAVPLKGSGSAAYLDADQIVEAALANNCNFIHPGYGFLSENPELAGKAEAAGITFLGPTAATLTALGDKANAKVIARECGVPVALGTPSDVSLDEAKEFYRSLGPDAAVVIKPLAGGGGRGIRVAHSLDELEHLYQLSASESTAVLNDARLMVEEYMPRSRHIEIQVIGDGKGNAYYLGARDCSVQRRFQKVVEIAPPPGLDREVLDRVAESAVTIARHLNYRSLGTFEFLVDADGSGKYIFMEANPRVQVEHTVTEASTGLDLIDLQFTLATTGELPDLAPSEDREEASAIQVRVNAETLAADGSVSPSGGSLTSYLTPSGPGVRVDGAGYPGYQVNPRYDSLLAKLIVFSHHGTFEQTVQKMYRALCEFRIEGLDTNLELLREIFSSDDLNAEALDTNYLEARLPALLASETVHRVRHSQHAVAAGDAVGSGSAASLEVPEGATAVPAPLTGLITHVLVDEGDEVLAGQPIAVVEAMKMEHEIHSPASGVLIALHTEVGAAVSQGDLLAAVEGSGDPSHEAVGAAAQEVDLDHIRADLQKIEDVRAKIYDDARPKAVERRHQRGGRTIRENLGDLFDADSFLEYGPFVVADQSHSFEELIERSPADGVITGFGTVNADDVDGDDNHVAIIGYDYSVYAGTQGLRGHAKTDRFLKILDETPIPLVVIGEGGGGRPNDRYSGMASGLTVPTFRLMGKLNGRVPSVAIVSGPCFAGNAALVGLCDTIIATKNSNIGMAGAPLIREAGLGDFETRDIGPIGDQTQSGVVDIAVEDEAEAVAVAKKYLSYFQGDQKEWEAHDQRKLRHVVPENRMRAYDMRALIEILADVDSVLELRSDFGREAITALARCEGKPFGIIANDPMHSSGAITSESSDKMARFLQLCDAYGIPVLSLMDTPGIMVGPEVERTGIVRHSSRIFIIATRMSVPFYTMVIRKGYGLGAPAMSGGNLVTGHFCVAWPTAEFGPMQLEGQIRLAHGRELETIEDEEERKRRFDELVAKRYEDGGALNLAAHAELDDVIDPADSRRWLATSLRLNRRREHVGGGMIDTW